MAYSKAAQTQHDPDVCRLGIRRVWQLHGIETGIVSCYGYSSNKGCHSMGISFAKGPPQ